MKRTFLLLATAATTMCTIAQDIDFPLSAADIKKYESRVNMQRLADAEITHHDAYKIKTHKETYPEGVKEITFDVINTDGPTAEPELYSLERWRNGRWEKFPFKDGIGFEGVGMTLNRGDTIPKRMDTRVYKRPLTEGKYRLNFYIFANICTYCDITDSTIVPVEGTATDGAFTFKVAPSTADSLRIVFENHTNLAVQPLFFPGIGTDSTYMEHPYARSGAREEYDYMHERARLGGGQAIRFAIPTAWDTARISGSAYRRRFAHGRLKPGRYKIWLQLHVYMHTPFNVSNGAEVD